MQYQLIMARRNELKVTYANTMNDITLSNLTPSEMDIFMLLCAKSKEKGVEEVLMSAEEFYARTGMQKTLRTRKELEAALYRMHKKVNSNSYMRKTDKYTCIFSIFNSVRYEKENDIISFKINEEFIKILNDFGKDNPFTSFEYQRFLSIKNKYTKQLYRQLMQWSSVGECTFKLEELKEKLSIPDSYTNKNITQKVIEPSISELKEKKIFNEIRFETMRSKFGSGSKVTGYHFTFTECVNDSLPGQIELKDICPTETISYVDESGKKQFRTVKKKNQQYHQFMHSGSEDLTDLEKELLSN